MAQRVDATDWAKQMVTCKQQRQRQQLDDHQLASHIFYAKRRQWSIPNPLRA
jgi:hypothetical protein